MNTRMSSTAQCLLAMGAAVLVVATVASASAEVKPQAHQPPNGGAVQPPSPFHIFSECPPATCNAYWDGGDDSSGGNTDFATAGIPMRFQFVTGAPLTWNCSQEYETCNATYGEGGSFTMTGPLGTFTGVVTSGFANEGPMGYEINVNFSGQWSTGLRMTGTADERYVDEFQIPDTQLDLHPGQ